MKTDYTQFRSCGPYFAGLIAARPIAIISSKAVVGSQKMLIAALIVVVDSSSYSL